MNSLENITDMILAVLVMFIGPIMIFSGLYRSAGLLTCEKEAHAFVNELETGRLISKEAYREFSRKISELPGKTAIYISREEYGSITETDNNGFSYDEILTDVCDIVPMDIIEKIIETEGEYSISPERCILLEIRYCGLVLYYRAYGGVGSRI